MTITALWYDGWMLTSINWSALWLSGPFVAANLLVATISIVAFINNWQRSSPPERLVSVGAEYPVAVVITICGEPVTMVQRTACTVLTQDWPHHYLRLVLSDDGADEQVECLARALQKAHPAATVLYHRPPGRGTPERRGDAKAGNLNSALDLIKARFPEVAYMETRDADDEVGDPTFLRQCIGQLQADTTVAFVQTIKKEARVSVGDPFGNMETLFYRGSMLARHAANAVVPCGSGLVWRMAALETIGGFPTWNLVEDLQAGVEALRQGWRGLYLPIVGVVSQHAPEDIPNVYKQRGVWALDTMRLLLWRRLGGLNLRQRLHFIGLGLFYLLSFALLCFVVVPMLSFVWHVYPLTTDEMAYAVHFWPFAAMLELFLVTLNGGRPYESLWRARQMWLGLAPVYARACIMALLTGPQRKPRYRVTRKVHRFHWYWRETLVQIVLTALLCASLTYGAMTTPLLTRFDLGSAFWASFLILGLGGFITKGWYGVAWRQELHAVVQAAAVSTHEVLTMLPGRATGDQLATRGDVFLTWIKRARGASVTHRQPWPDTEE